VSDDPPIRVNLTVEQARALTRAAELMMDCFGHEVRAELGCDRGRTPLEIAGQKLESAIERQEVLADVR
jgi:hypothetical protein